MLLRRIREHLAAQNWTAVGLDLVIVVVGVFLGIQVSNWNDARLERQAGKVYRQRLLDDFKANAEDLAMRSRYYSQVRDRAAAALAVVRNPEAPAGEQFLINLYEATQIIPRRMKRSTWDEILSTGALNLVGSPERREMVSNYYVSVDTVEFTFGAVTPLRAYIRARMPYDIQARVRERCPESIRSDARYNIESRLAASCTLALPPARTAEVAARLRQDPQLEEQLNAALTDLDSKIARADGFIGRSSTIVNDWSVEAD